MSANPVRKDPILDLGHILDSVAVPALIVERAPREGLILYATAAFCRASGRGSEALVGRSIDEFEGWRAEPGTESRLRTALREGCAANIRLGSGRDRSRGPRASLQLTPLLDHDGRAASFLCIRVEDSVRMGADVLSQTDVQRIAVSKVEWESTIDSLDELVLLVDSRMRLVRANRTIETWGLGRVHVVKGRDLHEVLHSPRCRRTDCPLVSAWNELRTRDDPHRTVEFTADDEILGKRINVTMHALQLRDGSSEAVTVVVRDVSRAHRRDEARRRQERFEAMGYLVGGLVHEIGNPLAALKATVDVWSRNLERFTAHDHSRFLSRVSAGIDRMQASVDRIRTWGAQRMEGDEVVPIEPILEEIQSLFQAQAAERRISLALADAPDRNLSVVGNASAIYEVCLNVVKNAIEACGAGDSISIEGVADDGAVTIFVRDTGTGIAESDIRHLFAPFFTTKPTGTGIGLAQANHLMEQMGARIDVQSVEGRGTTVILRFRRASGDQRAADL